MDEVAAMGYLGDLTKKYFGDEAFVWASQFRNWETNRVIQKELYTNLGLAFAAVLLVTLALVANIWACILVCLCVIITLVSWSFFHCVTARNTVTCTVCSGN